MPTRDLSSVFDDDALLYPGIKSKAHPEGKTYLVPAPDGQDGLIYTKLFDLGADAASGAALTKEDRRRLLLDDEGEATFYRKLLSKDTLDEMLADGVSWPMIQQVAADAFRCWGAGEQLADAALRARAAGKAAAPTNRAARRAKTPSGGKPTAKKTAGSRSSRASSGTPARTTGQASTQSSKSTRKAQPPTAATA